VFHEPRFRFEHGDHACVFYQSEDSLVETVIPYLVEGLQKREKCLSVQEPLLMRRLAGELRRGGIDVDREIERGALEFRSDTDTYRPDGTFRHADIARMVTESVEDSLRKGFRGFRSVGDLGWAANARIDGEELVKYEHRVAKCFAHRAFTGMCSYPAKRFAPKTLSAIRDAHTINVVDPELPSVYTWLQITKKPFVAEIVTDKFSKRASFSYLVRRMDSDNVLQFGDARDFESAKAEAERLLRAVSSKKFRKAKVV
jgi:hypothetical protein